MKHNLYWQMAAGGRVAPEHFNPIEWRAAIDRCASGIGLAARRFQKRPDRALYDDFMRAQAIGRTLLGYLDGFVRVLGGCTEKEWRDCKTYGLKTIGLETEVIIDAVGSFLASEADRGERVWARRERAVAYEALEPGGGAFERAEADLLARERGLDAALFRKWPGTAPDGLRLECRDGSGYRIAAGDHGGAKIIIGSHPNEEVRRSVWTHMQKTLPRAWEMQSFMDVRDAAAQRLGLTNYNTYINQKSGRLSIRTGIQTALKKIGAESVALRRAEDMEINKGVLEAGYTGPAAAAPWNQAHFRWSAGQGLAGVDSGVLPIHRITHQMIPDLLALGGWTVSGRPEKIGRGARSMHLYRIHNGERPALLYFSCHERLFRHVGDQYMAECVMMRERWTGKRPVTPMVVINADISAVRGGVESINDILYIAHEIGHALHFLSFRGNDRMEIDRTPGSVVELPSLMMERLVRCPKRLRAWANPKGPAKGRTLRYWQAILDDLSSTEGLIHLTDRVEMAAFDGLIQNQRANQGWRLLCNVRRRLGRVALGHGDREHATMFDISHVHAGQQINYVISEAIVAFLARGGDSSDTVMARLLGLLESSGETGFETLWKNYHGFTLKQSFEIGLDILIKEKLAVERARIKRDRACRNRE